MSEQNDDGAEDEEYFLELLEKRGTSWLRPQLEALGLTIPSTEPKQGQQQQQTPAATTQAADGFTAFLQGALSEEKQTTSALRTALEKVSALLTPEQRQALTNAAGGDPPKPPNNAPRGNNGGQQRRQTQPQPNEPQPKRKLFKRL